jgi:predicted alpha/beta superfamily hydrolase
MVIGAAADRGPAVCLPRSTWWNMPAGDEAGRFHRISLAWPAAPPPAAGYPALLVLDGNAGFGTAVEVYRNLAARGTVPPALILGLGHPGEAPIDQASRTRDYTPAVAEAPPGSGGAEAFLDFIEADLLPALEKRFPVDRSRLGLFGHSFGGLLAVHALLTRPALFRRVVAASPSLWWGQGAVLQAARHFAAAPPPRAADAALLLTVGALEEQETGSPRDALRNARRMVGNAAQLAALLEPSGLPVRLVQFPDEDHGSARAPALARAPRFVLSLPGSSA